MELNIRLNYACNGISDEVRITASGGDVKELNGQVQPTIQKKPYQEPRLCVYGDIGTITQTVAVVGIPDGNNKGSVHKTA
jgi:hypothetical protein